VGSAEVPWGLSRKPQARQEAPRGALITFSGLDGAGKSTQVEQVLSSIRQHGRVPVYLWTRGGYTPTFERAKMAARRLLRRALPAPGSGVRRERFFGNPAWRRLWLAFSLLDLLWVYGVKVRWWLAQRRMVVCDRYLWDTFVDFRVNLPAEDVGRWWLWRALVAAAPTPDEAFLLTVPVEESVARSHRKDEPFRAEPEALARRLALYEALAAEGRWHVLDGMRPLNDLQQDIQDRLARVLGRAEARTGGKPEAC